MTEHEIPEELREFIEESQKREEEEAVTEPVSESEFRGHMENQRRDFHREYLEAQMGILGVDEAIRQVDFAKDIGKRVTFFRKIYKGPFGQDMVQYGCDFEEKDEMGFKHERE